MFLEQFKPWNTSFGFAIGLGFGDISSKPANVATSIVSSSIEEDQKTLAHISQHKDTPVPSKRLVTRSKSLSETTTTQEPMEKNGLARTRQSVCADYFTTNISFARLVKNIAKREKYPKMTYNSPSSHIETDMIIQSGNDIAELEDFKTLGMRGIFICLIYLYYALNLFEQSWDGMIVEDLRNLFMNEEKYRKCLELIVCLSSGDLVKNCVNISKKIRRRFMGMSDVYTN